MFNVTDWSAEKILEMDRGDGSTLLTHLMLLSSMLIWVTCLGNWDEMKPAMTKEVTCS